MAKTRDSWSFVLRTFWPDLWSHRRPLAASYGARAVAVATTVLAPWPLKLIIDRVVVARGPSILGSAIVSPMHAILLMTAAFIVLMVIGAVANALEKNLSATIRERLTFELRDRLIVHFLTLPPTLRAKHRSGELVLRIVDDTDLFVRVLTKTLPQIFQHALTLVGTLAAMVWVGPAVALAGTIWIPIVAVVLHRDARRLWMASREKRTREGEVCGLAQEIVRGMTVIQASGGEQSAREAFGDVNRHRVRAGRAETAVAVGLERSLQIVQGLAMAAVTGGGAWLVLRGSMSVGDLTLMAAYVAQLLKPIEKLNDLAETTGRGMAGGERLLRLFEQRAVVSDAAGAVDVRDSVGVLELRDVWFSYADRHRPVLRGVNLRLQPGELTVLVGGSGVGKSTLFSLLVRLFDPAHGTITLDGQPLTRISLRSLRSQVAVLSQDTHLFAGTIRRAIVPRNATPSDDELWRALALVSMDGFVRQLPDGLDTPLGEDGVNLSGGQRRRLALARAFLLRRPILLLDEPLANVDAESAAVILGAIEQLRGHCTCFAITHEHQLAALADRVCRLVDGTIVEHRVTNPVAMLAVAR